MKRRDFLKMSAASAAFPISRKLKIEPKTSLVRLTAEDGFRSKVFLDGKQMYEVTEITAAIEPNKPVQGSVTFITNIKRGEQGKTILDGDEIKTETK